MVANRTKKLKNEHYKSVKYNEIEENEEKPDHRKNVDKLIKQFFVIVYPRFVLSLNFI